MARALAKQSCNFCNLLGFASFLAFFVVVGIPGFIIQAAVVMTKATLLPGVKTTIPATRVAKHSATHCRLNVVTPEVSLDFCTAHECLRVGFDPFVGQVHHLMLRSSELLIPGCPQGAGHWFVAANFLAVETKCCSTNAHNCHDASVLRRGGQQFHSLSTRRHGAPCTASVCNHNIMDLDLWGFSELWATSNHHFMDVQLT